MKSRADFSAGRPQRMAVDLFCQEAHSETRAYLDGSAGKRVYLKNKNKKSTIGHRAECAGSISCMRKIASPSGANFGHKYL